MGKMRKEAISIIVGSDGPTSVFVAGKTGKQSVKMRIKNAIYRRKQKKAKKRIHPGSHTLEEVLEYAKEHYDITEISTTQRLSLIHICGSSPGSGAAWHAGGADSAGSGSDLCSQRAQEQRCLFSC